MEEKKVLICPLNWGLGHASRCVPLIDSLIAIGVEVTIATSGNARSFLSQRFGNLQIIDFPDYRVRVPKNNSLLLQMLLKMPLFLHYIRKEHSILNKLIDQHHYDLVISDNRYGLYSNKTRCVFITHQLMVKCPPFLRFAEATLHRIILRYIKKFDQCLIPDVAGKINLSGDLSHKYPLPANSRFVGLMSRFNKTDDVAPSVQPCYDILAILSGPEPQRSHAETLLNKALQATGKKCALVQGKPGANQMKSTGNIDVYNHLDDPAFASMIHNAKLLVCRPGYSSIMDLIILGKSALVVPTPGQTEQLYLAEHLQSMGWFQYITQSDINKDILLQYLSIPAKENCLPELTAFSEKVEDYFN